MNLGYSRVSTTDQGKNGHSLDAQQAALKAAGCERIFADTASGRTTDRPQLKHLLDQLRKDDVLVVCKLDRLSRSLLDVLNLMDKLAKQGIGFRSLRENVDTTTASGRAMMHMVMVFAQFERDMLSERTREGLQEARRKGKVSGRPFKLPEHQRRDIVKQVRSGEKSAADAARYFGISQSAVSRLLARATAKEIKADAWPRGTRTDPIMQHPCSRGLRDGLSAES